MKKFFAKLLILFLITNASNAKIVNLVCEFEKRPGRDFSISLDFNRSIWIDHNKKIERHMIYDDRSIMTSYPTAEKNDHYTHFFYTLSRNSGNGVLRGYKIDEEKIQLVTDLAVDEMIMKNVGNLDDKSLDFERERIFSNQWTNFLTNEKQVTSDLLYKCETAEKKF
jgi:hypothetical protein